jgi:hypothetical protein
MHHIRLFRGEQGGEVGVVPQLGKFGPERLGGGRIGIGDGDEAHPRSQLADGAGVVLTHLASTH